LIGVSCEPSQLQDLFYLLRNLVGINDLPTDALIAMHAQMVLPLLRLLRPRTVWRTCTTGRYLAAYKRAHGSEGHSPRSRNICAVDNVMQTAVPLCVPVQMIVAKETSEHSEHHTGP
jgi:hypothetical protein